MRVLLLGAGGMLARDVVREAPPHAELIRKTHTDLDITNQGAVTTAIAAARPDVIINAAGYTAVDIAETESKMAFSVNGDAPRWVGLAASRSLVVHFSTDYVFDGRSRRPYRETDRSDPLGVYGASKLAGEGALLDTGARCVIIRTSWLFGRHGKSFPRTMWQRARDHQATRVVNDQVGRPTYTVDLARATWALIGKLETDTERRPTILHVANQGEATWYDVAKQIFDAAGVANLLSTCTTAEYPTPARRPAYSVLDTSEYEARGEPPLPRWEDALDRFLKELQAA